MAETIGSEFEYRVESIGGWDVPVVEFAESVRKTCTFVRGTIVNSITENSAGQKDWKRRVASEVKAVRGYGSWDSSSKYAVSLGMTFHPSNHGYRSDLDVENFIKPVLDAVAAGLFCAEDLDVSTIERWNFDDSNFRTLLIHRFEDASNPGSEGVAIYVSAV